MIVDKTDLARDRDGDSGYLSPTRRRLLTAGVIGGGILGISQFNDDNPDEVQSRETSLVREAENDLVGLAARITDVGLVDPLNIQNVRRDIAYTIAAVDQTLDNAQINSASIENRVDTVRAAIEYYTTFEQTLKELGTLKNLLAESEPEVLHHDATFDEDPTSKFNPNKFKVALSELSNPKEEPETLTSEGRPLVPKHSYVLESIKTQKKLIGMHLAAQRAYLITANTIEAGVRAHEESRLEEARSILTNTKESLTIGIPEKRTRHRISQQGVSLEQFAKLLSLRRRGVTKLLSVSEASISTEERRTVSNDALNFFFQARRIVSTY